MSTIYRDISNTKYKYICFLLCKLMRIRNSFSKRIKHIEVDCHFIIEKIASACMTTSFVNSNDQLADNFTKSLRGLRIQYICDKLDAFDLYALA